MHPLIVVTIIFLLCGKKCSSTKRYISYLLQQLILQLYLFYIFCVLNTKCTLHSLCSDSTLPAEIWSISYNHPLPLDFFLTHIMIDSGAICNRMIFLAYFITFFSLMIILRETHFFLSAHRTHYFFIARCCFVCSITSSLW